MEKPSAFVKAVLLVLSLSLLCGCAPVLVGTGVVAGYVFSNDAAMGNINIAYRDLWDICLQRLEVNAVEVVGINESKGIVKARSAGANIVVRIYSLGSQQQRLKVTARKKFLPKPYIAQDIFFKIIKEFE